jgi:hypothetical protein
MGGDEAEMKGMREGGREINAVGLFKWMAIEKIRSISNNSEAIRS